VAYELGSAVTSANASATLSGDTEGHLLVVPQAPAWCGDPLDPSGSQRRPQVSWMCLTRAHCGQYESRSRPGCPALNTCGLSLAVPPVGSRERQVPQGSIRVQVMSRSGCLPLGDLTAGWFGHQVTAHPGRRDSLYLHPGDLARPVLVGPTAGRLTDPADRPFYGMRQRCRTIPFYRRSLPSADQQLSLSSSGTRGTGRPWIIRGLSVVLGDVTTC